MNSFEKITKRNLNLGSCLCVGLDSALDKLPANFSNNIDSLFEFNRTIIEITKDLASAYKINFAFYERYGVKGMKILERTIALIPEEVHIIADAKRGDIGNTSKAYADSAFAEFRCDSITVSPYMGKDSVEPFLEYSDKMVFVLALTSNPGSSDFQRLISEGKPIYRYVIEKCCEWAGPEQIGFVVGATHPRELADIRSYIADRCLLVPGVGKQGGSPDAIIEANNGGPMLVNSSRAIIYAGNGPDWEEVVRNAAIDSVKSLAI